MAESSKILEGVFAINKPPSLSSAQVLRDLQNRFADSKTFAPLLAETRRKEEERARHQSKKRKRQSQDNVFKMGHGGTLDPLATGVLIVGIGKGTKHLNNFLGCTKTYDTVVLFGKSTDTYDVAGKVVADAPFKHVTKELVESKLENFRGNIKQIPPIYSALKIQGMKAYEYARSGKELPRELESRDMCVSECTMLDWYEGETHDYRWPADEAAEEDKAAARKLMRGADLTKQLPGDKTGHLDSDGGAADFKSHEEAAKDSNDTVAVSEPSNARPADQELNSLSPSVKAALHTHQLPAQSTSPAEAPAARIRLTVSSGFYVRSFAHDLGVACGSLGIMSELLRSRQGDFICTEPPADELIPCLTYQDLERGEDIWGPKISSVLEKWIVAHPDGVADRKFDDRDQHDRRYGSKGTGGGFRGGRRDGKRSWSDRKAGTGPRRNSSSPEL